MDQKVNALIIANKMVFPALDGGSLAMQNLCQMLVKQNYNIDLISIAKNNEVKKIKKPIISNCAKNTKQILFEKNMQFNIVLILKSIVREALV